MWDGGEGIGSIKKLKNTGDTTGGETGTSTKLDSNSFFSGTAFDSTIGVGERGEEILTPPDRAIEGLGKRRVRVYSTSSFEYHSLTSDRNSLLGNLEAKVGEKVDGWKLRDGNNVE